MAEDTACLLKQINVFFEIKIIFGKKQILNSDFDYLHYSYFFSIGSSCAVTAVETGYW
jgi:hypothetical protein